QAIDATVLAHDPVAVRRVLDSLADRRVEFGSPTDATGFTSVWALLPAADAAALRDRLETIARSVCPSDPRTLDVRRADALAALGAGRDALTCQCELDDADAAQRPAPARNTVGIRHHRQHHPRAALPGDPRGRARARCARAVTQAGAAVRPAASCPPRCSIRCSPARTYAGSPTPATPKPRTATSRRARWPSSSAAAT
ncbi:DUF222 domain-containing protein, partial [Mycobacterium rufum]|nr:DUF222 domain-containing protein [Mycolicibacterium rufum]